MPELPEVLTITKDLKKEVIGNKVVSVTSFQNYRLDPSKEFFDNYIINYVITNVGNVAKLIYLKFSSDYYIATHLNMSGRLLYNVKDPYVKIQLGFKNNTKLNYSSVRMFGYFEVWDNAKLEEYKKRYAKTALDKSLSLEDFIAAQRKRNTYIKNTLLDQKLVSGIGNIYANDALFLSKIHPQRKSGEITDKEYKDLFSNVRLLLNEGIKHRGSSIDRYTDLYGKPGTHQNYFRAYGKKKGEPCMFCKTPLTFEKMQGRGTFYCSICQKLDTRVSLF